LWGLSPMILFRFVSDYSLCECEEAQGLPRSNVRGSLATKTISAPLSRRSIWYSPLADLSSHVVPEE